MSTAPEWTPPQLRPEHELVAMIDHVTANGYSSNRHDGYDKGLLAVLNWATGRTEQPPVSPTPLGRPVTGNDAKREQYRAHEAMQGGIAEPELRKVAQEKGQGYLTGAENTLAWVIGGDALWAPWET
ncbi:hypothetical protein [Streptomyces sp. NBC_01750]|uniref:hypothetical protein n=1 Tax=Streptomyces sp. NBC_01750 TaxID=2975928 RepID=UPI002DDB151F|nr:hypothetical protein [Streptomyces sp. NBC_01750]WSD38112.1 hypothetical protein OG966_40390 [Streptomyces sp. NBC_01750]